MSSGNRQFNTPFKPGEVPSAAKLNSLREAADAYPLVRNIESFVRATPMGQFSKSKSITRKSPASLDYVYTGELTKEPTPVYGSLYSEPGTKDRDFSESEGITFHIATLWNTLVTAPEKMYGQASLVGKKYIFQLQKFYVRCDEIYSATADVGIVNFTCFYAKSSTSLNLGDQDDFPSGRKCILKGFDAVNAGSDNRSAFNGTLYEATYNPTENIIYLDHPQF